MRELIDLIETESVGTVEETLDFLLYECSLDDAPSREEVVQWCDLLNGRGGKFVRLAKICQIWLDEEGENDLAAQ
ncbi:dioxygenase [Neisseria weixii]|uniref:Dioxygenase n=1 Tax=Neisseria weixii TaxID=1853276 RepID=A0A3N4N4W7_9NEIS|nr:dioxygenase [Neisseria weixii]ATD65071.1 dioxygenase [Neisseria weixii]RPD90395.1 dioxygenase [Neisseria weixii]RPD90663.1 dioxygenase [Neisseria weixii]